MKSRETTTEAEVVEKYQTTRDLSGFEGAPSEPVEVRRNVTISVRFSDEEIGLLRARAEAAGMKVTAHIRDAALQDAAPIDRRELRRTMEAMRAEVARLGSQLGDQVTSRET